MSELLTCQNYINGEFVKSQSHLDVFNPADGKIITQVPNGTVSDVNDAVAAAKLAQHAWSNKSAVERGAVLHQVADQIRANADSFARTISREQGKIMPLAQMEVEFAASYFDYTAEWARRLEGEVITSDRPNEHMFLRYKPIGVVAGILPWNFPFFLIARKMAPALLTGNTIVIKPSQDTPVNAHEFAKILQHTDIPDGVFNLVSGKGSTLGPALSRHPDVGLVTFTGSIATGRLIMKDAAENITKVNLELGGKAPVIIMADADIDLTVEKVVASRIINSGQVCNCAERVYVQDAVKDEFLEKIAKAMSNITFGNGIAAHDAGQEIDMGPQINAKAVSDILAMVDSAKAKGAEVLTGGQAPDQEGSFYQPTVLANCTDDMSVMSDEIFGPVLPVRAITDLDEGIALANDSIMGLTSSIFTSNLNSAMRASRELKFGETYVNREHGEAFQGFHAGVRQSGLGGADGKHGLYEFMETHVTYIQET
jgi:lactaldehyde dehydrogenase/glycolaldehyde dehydrogenase